MATALSFLWLRGRLVECSRWPPPRPHSQEISDRHGQLSLPTGGRWPLPCPSFGCVAALLNAVVGRRLDRIPKDLALARTPRFLVHPNVFTRSGVMFRSTLHPQGLTGGYHFYH